MITASLEGRTIAIRGDTFDLKSSIAAIGGRWHAPTKTWRLPATAEAAASARGLGAQMLDCGDLLAEVFAPPGWPPDVRPMNDPDKAPWSHQVKAFDFAVGRSGSVLRLKMRMGKTLTALALAVAWQARLILVTCPVKVMEVWRDEVEEHVPGRFRVVVLDQGRSVAKKAAALASALRITSPLIVVVNYQSVWRGDLGTLVLKTGWDLVIADEGHMLKAPGSSVSRFMARVRATRRLAPTGTFLPNGVADAYAQMRFVAPWVFGTSAVAFNLRYKPLVEPVTFAESENGFLVVKAHFKRLQEMKALQGGRFHKPSGAWLAPDTEENRRLLASMGAPGSTAHAEAMADFAAKLARAVVSIDYDEADISIPASEDPPVYVDLSDRAMVAYEAMRRHMVAELEQGDLTAANALVKSLRLSQICSGVVQTDDGTRVVVDDSKIAGLRGILEGWFDEDRQPVVVFCRFRADLDRIERLANELGATYGEISGNRKDGQAGRFLTPGAELVGVQLQSGGLGLDFFASHLAPFMTLSWSASDYEQARYRFFGQRQKNVVTFPHLIARGTIEETLWAALKGKIDLSEAVMGYLKGK